MSLSRLVLVGVVAWASQVPQVDRAARREDSVAGGRMLYVRQTVGDDAHDGLAPERAWRRLSKLSRSLRAGDTAYVGPGLYREILVVPSEGTEDRRIRLIADPTGEHTGDPPGRVIITGADPVDEQIFAPYSERGVYVARPSRSDVFGVVEMDGSQFRYLEAGSTPEHVRQGLTELEVVARRPRTYFFDVGTRTLYLHTGDGEPPSSHEMELIHRGSGILVGSKSFVTVQGFVIRHVDDAGIVFSEGARGGIALDNVAYGSRQGIRVRGASQVIVAGNTLFRNENSGIYFLSGSLGSVVVGNVLYENVKGIRWGSGSNGGTAIANTAFHNLEAGIAVEKSSGARIFNNVLVGNRAYQLLSTDGGYHSDANCLERRGPEQLLVLADTDGYRSLSEYRQARRQDLGSREGGCGHLPEKLDVRGLHAASLRYR